MFFAVNDWVVWDVGYLDKFFDYVRGAIGSSVGIGILIFAVVFGIALISVIVHKFTRGK